MGRIFDRLKAAGEVLAGRASIVQSSAESAVIPVEQEEATPRRAQVSEHKQISSEADRSVFRVTHTSHFSCQYCGTAGKDTFETSFPEGYCPQCGAGAHKCDEVKFVDEFPFLDESFFVVFADDTKDPSQELVGDLKKKGAHVVTLEDLLPNGMSTDQIPYVLEQAAMRAPWIIFVPSPQFQEDKEQKDDLILDVVFTQILRGQQKKIAPAYVDKTYIDMVPFLMGTRMGMFLDGSDEQYVGFGKKWFLNQVPGMLEKMKKGH